MVEKKLKITLLSDSAFITTGYSDQSKKLAKFFSDKGHEVHYLSANAYQGQTIKNCELEDGTKFNYFIHGIGRQPYSADLISPLLKETNSDIFIVLLDTFMLHGGNAWFLGVDTAPAQSFFWFPSDGGGGLPVDCSRILQKFDVPVAMAQFGQKQVKDYHQIDAEFIPHGVETDRFYRLPDDQRNELRNKWGLNGKFVIGVMARNQPRKFLDRTLKTMSILKDKIPNAVLFMHLDPDDPAQIFNMRNLISRYNLENRVFFSGTNAFKGFDWSQMNEVYNVMDVLFHSSSGEGFGIGLIEAMACEVPIVGTDYTTTRELIINNKAGLGIKLSGTEMVDLFKLHSKDFDNQMMNGTITGGWEVERGVCDVHDASEKLIYLYENPDVRKVMGENGRKAVLEKYDFEKVVGPRWLKLIEERCGK